MKKLRAKGKAKALKAAHVMALAVLCTAPAAPAADSAKPLAITKPSLKARLELVRQAFPPTSPSGIGAPDVRQWGNWVNFPNFPNFPNFGNFPNFPNFGNFRNF